MTWAPRAVAGCAGTSTGGESSRWPPMWVTFGYGVIPLSTTISSSGATSTVSTRCKAALIRVAPFAMARAQMRRCFGPAAVPPGHPPQFREVTADGPILSMCHGQIKRLLDGESAKRLGQQRLRRSWSAARTWVSRGLVLPVIQLRRYGRPDCKVSRQISSKLRLELVCGRTSLDQHDSYYNPLRHHSSLQSGGSVLCRHCRPSTHQSRARV